MTGANPTTVVLTVRQWHAIDGTLDNIAHVAAVDGDEDTLRRARRLREYGWYLSRTHVRAGEGELGWPPVDERFVVELDPDDWRLVRRHLDRALSDTHVLLASDRLHPSVRAEQAASLAGLEDVIAALDGVG